MGVLTFLSGALGFVTGVHASLAAAGDAGLANLAMIGIAESIDNLVLAFAFLGVGVAITTVRALRATAPAS
jgi:hypothetical protein